MISRRLLRLIWLTVACIALTRGFNIEPRNLRVLSSSDVQNGSWFGNNIILLPISTGELKAYLGAPLHRNKRNEANAKMNKTMKTPNGAVYECLISENSNASMTCVSRSFGNSSAAGMTTLRTSKDTMLVCGPQGKYICRNAKLPIRMVGECYIVNITNFAEDDPEPLPSPCITDCPGGLDVIFLLDSSGSVRPDNFTTAKKWLISTMRGLSEGMAHGDIHVGFIQYSGATMVQDCESGFLTRLISIELPLGSYRLSYASEKVMNATPFSQCTLTGDSINVTVDEFIARGRKHNVDIMIVITDGKSSDEVTGASNHARNHGIHMIAIGIGTNINMTELENIAQNNESVFTVENFSSLDSILTSLQEAILLVSSSSLEGKGGNSTSNLTQCMMGMSASLSENNTVRLGATGACDSKGTIISRRLNEGDKIYTFPEKHVETLLGEKVNLMKDSYLGYSMTTGYFLGKSKGEWIVTGIPRYLGYGAVAVYKENSGSLGLKDLYLIRCPKDSQALRQMGSYFGHTLCAMDVNADGADDLLVGAPLHSDEESTSYDEGCVVIFYGNTLSTEISFMEESLCKIQGFGKSSRFGMAIADAGDLDRDSYHDFIVGAPGYDDHQGEIVVFYGDTNCPHRFQRISPAKLGISLQYFGYAIAVLDDLTYSNATVLIVTSPKAQSLVVLSSRPVIDLTANLLVTSLSDEDPGSLDVAQCAKRQSLGSPCATLVACFRISWRDKTQMSNGGTIEISYELTLDAKFKHSAKRMVFAGSNTHIVKVANHVQSTSKQYLQYSLILRPNILSQVDAVDFSEPVVISMLAKISDTVQERPMTPILPVQETRFRTTLNFSTGCVGKGNCLYDLVIKANATAENPIRMDEVGKILPVIFTLENRGDHAFFTEVLIVTRNVDISRIVTDCAYLKDDRQTIRFRHPVFGSMFMRNSLCKVAVMFSLLKLAKYANETEIEVNATVFSSLSETTEAPDITPEDNIVTLKKGVIYLSSIDVKSHPVSGEIRYWRNVSMGMQLTSLTEEGIFGGENGSIVHSYTIRNTGPFTISAANLSFTWPAFTTGAEFPVLYLFVFECKPASKCLCSSEAQCEFVNPWKLSYDAFVSSEEIQRESQCPITRNSSIRTTLRLNLPKEYPFWKQNEAICKSTRNSSFDCHSLSCQLSSLKPDEDVELEGIFKLWIPTFKLKKETPKVYVASNLELHITQPAVYPKVYKQSAVTSTYQYFSQTEPVKQRSPNVILYLVAILVGLVLVGITTLVFWKCGYFESKYEKLKKEFQPSDEEQEVIAIIAAGAGKTRGQNSAHDGRTSLVCRISAEENAPLLYDSLLEASQEFKSATKSQSREKLDLKDSQNLEMTPMKKYLTEKEAFDCTVRTLTLPQRDMSISENPILQGEVHEDVDVLQLDQI